MQQSTSKYISPWYREGMCLERRLYIKSTTLSNAQGIVPIHEICLYIYAYIYMRIYIYIYIYIYNIYIYIYICID